MPASTKWRRLGHLQLLSRAVAVMAEIEVSPQEEVANPEGMKVFAVERYAGLPQDSCLLVLCVECNRRPTRICAESADCLGSATYSGRYRERLCASGLRSLELSAQVRRPNSCISCKPAPMDASITRTGRNG